MSVRLSSRCHNFLLRSQISTSVQFVCTLAINCRIVIPRLRTNNYTDILITKNNSTIITETMAPKVEKVTESVLLGEAPHWDISLQSLFFVDIIGKEILKYIPATKKVTRASTAPKQVSFIIPVDGKKDQFVISLDNDVVVISWDGASDKFEVVEKLATLDGTGETKNNMANDAKVDSAGRLWVGTHGINPALGIEKTQPLGSLYSFNGKNDVKKHVDKIKISNGLGWNDKIKKFYFVDSLKGTIDQYDYSPATGIVANVQPLFTPRNHGYISGFADGLCVDADGNLWVAIFGGGKILKVDGKKPETLLETVDIPAINVTSTAWGGKNLDELYVTTAQKEGDPSSDAGATFKVTGTGAKGLPALSFKL